MQLFFLAAEKVKHYETIKFILLNTHSSFITAHHLITHYFCLPPIDLIVCRRLQKLIRSGPTH